jgi:hypothetical protein
MSFKKPDRQYWDDKFAAYLHDPFDKVFRIQGHRPIKGNSQTLWFGYAQR